MRNIERSPAKPAEKKPPTCRCSGETGPLTRACFIATPFVVAALFGAAPATAQLRNDLERGADVRLAPTAAPDVRVRGAVLRVEGSGNTIIVWPRTAAHVQGNGSTVIVWPRTAAPVEGNDTTVLVWPRAAARVEGSGNVIVVWPRTVAHVQGNGSTIVVWPRTAAPVEGNDTNDTTVIVWPRTAARVEGSGNVIVVWPRTAARGEGNGTTVIVWPRAAGVETGYAVADIASIEVRAERDRKRGTLIGAGIATALAALFCGTDRAHGEMSSGEVAGTVARSAVAGGLLGYAFAPRGWRRLPLPARP